MGTWLFWKTPVDMIRNLQNYGKTETILQFGYFYQSYDYAIIYSTVPLIH